MIKHWFIWRTRAAELLVKARGKGLRGRAAYWPAMAEANHEWQESRRDWNPDWEEVDIWNDATNYLSQKARLPK